MGLKLRTMAPVLIILKEKNNASEFKNQAINFC